METETLTIIYVKDQQSGGYTSCFAEHPECIAEGDTKVEAKINLFILLTDVLNDQ